MATRSKWLFATIAVAVSSSSCFGTAGRADDGGARTWQTDALVFGGDGVWSDEKNSLEGLLEERGASWREVSSAELDAMSVDEIATYGMLIFPGGSGGTQTKSLSLPAHLKLREAVQVRGVSFIGFCAGAWIAVAPKPADGQPAEYGFGLYDGPVLDYYYLTDDGVEVQMTPLTLADGTKRDIFWYGGPITPEAPGTVIAKYPDGHAAISQVRSGNGFLTLSGPHPGASQAARDSFGVSDSDGLDMDFTWQLLQSTLHKTPMPAF